MKFEIHYTIEDHDDSFIVEGEDINDVRAKSNKELSKRNLKLDENCVYSTPIE
jgi:hypothetical protein